MLRLEANDDGAWIDLCKEFGEDVVHRYRANLLQHRNDGLEGAIRCLQEIMGLSGLS